jgi:hypothetical protein
LGVRRSRLNGFAQGLVSMHMEKQQKGGAADGHALILFFDWLT